MISQTFCLPSFSTRLVISLLDRSETVVRKAMFQACEETGHRMTDALHLGLIGQARDTTDATLMAHYGADFPLADYRERCRIYFEDICRTEVPVKPGARELLQFLRARRIPTAVATSTARGAQRGKSPAHGLCGFCRCASFPRRCGFGQAASGKFSESGSAARCAVSRMSGARRFPPRRSCRTRGRHGDHHGAGLAGRDAGNPRAVRWRCSESG